MNEHNALPMGTILNRRYKVIRSMGSGGFSITYLVYDEELDVNAAVKECFPFNLAARSTDAQEVAVQEGKKDEFEQLKAVFQKEAGFIYGTYDQPGICSVKDFFSENNTVYIVEEFLPGGTLKEYLKKQAGSRVSTEECLAMMRPVMHGIAMLHEKGAVHGDISPDNLLFDGQGRLKLIDFGSVYVSEDGQESNRTFKPYYAAPEQYLKKGHSLIGPWTDLYGLCAVIYECLTGKRPLTVQERLKNKTVKPIHDYADVSPAFEQGILQGMELEISRRFFYMGTLQERIGCPNQEVIARLPKTREIWGGKWMQAATEGLQLTAGRKRFFTTQQKKQFLKAEATVLGVFGAAVLVLFIWIKAHPIWALDMRLRQNRVKAYQQITDDRPQMTIDDLDENILASLDPYLNREDTDGSKYYYNIPNQWFLDHPGVRSHIVSFLDTEYLASDLSFAEDVLSYFYHQPIKASGSEASGTVSIRSDGSVNISIEGKNTYYLPDGAEMQLKYDVETERLMDFSASGKASAVRTFLKNIFPYIVPETYLTENEIEGLFAKADRIIEQDDGSAYYNSVTIPHPCYRIISLSRQGSYEEQSGSGQKDVKYRVHIEPRSKSNVLFE